jgi:mono/diheme cytochrome c family protein
MLVVRAASAALPSEEVLIVSLQSSRLVVGFVTAALLAVPLLTSGVEAQKKPAQKKPAPKKPAPKSPAGDAKAGQADFKAEGCVGCHKTKEFQAEGGALGPDLSKIAKEHDAKFIAGVIRKPPAGSNMPEFKGSQKTLDNLVAYLMTQK